MQTFAAILTPTTSTHYFEQPGMLFRAMDEAQRAALFANTARSLGDAPLQIKQRHVENCRRADAAYGDGVAAALGLRDAVPS